jgi:hypothetical protein
MPVLPVPSQELALVKRGLDAYHAQLRRLGITVEAPYMDDEYCWWGFWNDDAVEAAIGGPNDPMGVATCVVTQNGAGKTGRKQAGASAYYVFSMLRHILLHDGDGPGSGASDCWFKNFNRVNAGPLMFG